MFYTLRTYIMTSRGIYKGSDPYRIMIRTLSDGTFLEI
mgnify:CR=1 FL=1